jgi:hypothetical protein
MLRVRVIGAAAPGGDELPDVVGRHQVLEHAVRFIPHFPFESGVRFRATFDPRQLGRGGFSEVLTLEFSLPKETTSAHTHVRHVFPSSESLPANLLRFYVSFSNPMQRGLAEGHIKLLGPDGRPAPDVLYRPPVELWDGRMMYLTILLDPGRLKRGLGPNRALGPPLKAGERYTLAIGPGIVDVNGRPLREGFNKSFRVTEAVREPIAVEQWRIEPPAANSHQPLELGFERPLDWALLLHKIVIASEGGQPLEGRITIEQRERRWTFVPESPWAAGMYCVRVASGLEDVCGNSLTGAFDRPIRGADEWVGEVASRSIPFEVKESWLSQF